MAAYAALTSLMNILEQIQNHHRLSTSLDKKQTEFLAGKVDFLLDFIEKYSHEGSKEVEDLESQIASATHAAEDAIESHIVDRILAESTEKSSSFVLDLQNILQDMESVKEKVMKVKEERGFKDQQLKYSMPAASSRPLATGKTTMVGFAGYLSQLLDGLTGQKSDRQVLPITGMGGIGKTTLARNVYENLLIVEYFDACVWVTISQEYNVKHVLLEILSCLKGFTIGMHEEDQLGEQIHKILSGRRYLVILDDMWSIEAWYKIKFFFPEDSNRSRIIITSRILDVANHFGSSTISVDFLDDDQSWYLFCENVFAPQRCPPELEEIGKKIVKKCKGLPLSIVAIGGLLRKSSRTLEYWESVAKDINSILSSLEDNPCMSILLLSYRHLPPYLKPCFLYFGIFSEDSDIYVPQLIRLWVAEGFIKSNKDQSLEEVAKDYINDLIDRNLILVRKLGRRGNFKICSIHDLVRDLCLMIAEKEKFLCVRVLDAQQDIDRERRIIIHESTKEYEEREAFHTLKSTSLTRSLICPKVRQSLELRLLRVLKEVRNESMDDILQLVNLRFLAHDIDPSWRIITYNLPSSISLLWNLQTLIIGGRFIEVVAPSEIWQMPQLRHVKCMWIRLPDPPLSDKQDSTVSQNLQTLGRVLNFTCSDEACERMSNIKKLQIEYDGSLRESEKSLSDYCLHNVGRLNKLESLHCFFIASPNRKHLLENLMLPRSLKKLCLRNCRLRWNDLTVIGSLPHLEVLLLHCHSIEGPKWNPIEEEFLRLKYLGIYWCDLINWNAENSHFPVLESLTLHGMTKLDEIPSGIGDIPTLATIEVCECTISTAISAMKILDEQESLENQCLHVRIGYSDEKKQSEFKEKVELEGFTCHNFQLFG